MFLLCSDGFYNLLMQKEILDAIYDYKRNKTDIQKRVEKLMKMVKERGAIDNASVILIDQNFNKAMQGPLQRMMVRWIKK